VAPEDRPPRGIALMVFAMALASIMDALSKLLATYGHHPMQIAWARFLFIALFLIPVLATQKSGSLKTARPGLQFVRGMAMCFSSVFFIAALSLLPMADAAALVFVLPFFVTAFSIPLLGERIGIRRWAAVAVGFVGVLIIVRPGGAGYGVAALLPIASAVCGALGFITTRMMRSTEPVLTTLVLSALIALAITSAAAPFVWTALDARSLALMVAIGALSAASQYVLILAFQYAQPSLLAPFLYSQMLWAIVLGFALFDALPDMATLVGAAIIIASGIYTWHRERRAHLTAAKAPAAPEA
jgi:drug/metabolite transporter (DMT)-like permease